MALMRAKDVPADGVAMDEVEATNYVWNMVSDWESASDTWALNYAPVVLGAINAFSGVMINKHYRMKLKLGNYGYMSSVIPISLMPGVLTALFHRHLVSTDVLLMKRDGCPLCYEVRSAAIQSGFGIIYPMILGPASALMFANRYSTFRTPDLFEGPKVMYRFLAKLTKPFTGTLTKMLAIQLIASSVLTYFEMKNNITLRGKILALEKKMTAEEGLSS